MSEKTAIIIGAGPAGLTAAFELATRSAIQPVVLERDQLFGGISRTVNYKGNRIDIGGHRFFSKSDRVMDWWLKQMPLERLAPGTQTIAYQNRTHTLTPPEGGPDPAITDTVMLVRQRKSRIYFLRRFFDYPISLGPSTLNKLGAVRTVKIGLSYMRSLAFPIAPERNLEDFFINRFGRELYQTFFKAYTEKVWGAKCADISAEWGAQRIKGLSVTKAITHFLKALVAPRSGSLAQKDTETSLIEQFLYPKLGPGQMWDTVAEKVAHAGGVIQKGVTVTRIRHEAGRILSVEATNEATGVVETHSGDYFFSTMPIRELLAAFDPPPPADVAAVAQGLVYRDFMTVGLLLSELKVKEADATGQRLIKDNWIYIQEPDVQVGRMQVFNNWSPYMVSDPDKVWVGLEYFCYEGDALWNLDDAAMIALGIEELARIGIIESPQVLDAVRIRMPKAYPAYLGSYGQFETVRAYLDSFANLFPVGRNGMHKYNNQDHSMLTAMLSVDQIIAGTLDKAAIWDVNTEDEYHESK